MASISATSWLHTARNVRLQGSSTLAADLQQRDGSWTSAAFDLNEVLGNSNGKFDWGGTNFAETARGTAIQDRRPGAQEAWILASLQHADGYWPSDTQDAGLNITNALTNENGSFNWVGRSG